MDAIHVVLTDLDSHTCTVERGRALTNMLSSDSAMRVRPTKVITHLSTETLPAAPNLILLRISSVDNRYNMIQHLREKWYEVPLLGLICIKQDIICSSVSDMLTGLNDFITCPFKDIDVLPRIQRLLQDRVVTDDITSVAPMPSLLAKLQHSGLIGKSQRFQKVLKQALDVAQTDATILLTGETGTGKELVARAAHYHSPRQREPFVPINCGALPEHLVENELFGHVKGAYTDATSPEKGLVAEADGGTLFLDEVDALSTATQVKLLRFLQEREYRPVGSTRCLSADVRVIAASNADLYQLVQAKQFREDLYYRLNVIALRLPPLRERRDDIPLLAIHFLRRYNARYGREVRHLTAESWQKLAAYAWPGNIRELEAVIQRAVLVAASSLVTPDDIKLNHLNMQTEIFAQDALADVVPQPLSGAPGECPVFQERSLREAKEHVVAEFERSYLSHVLAAHHGNITQAAKQAGKERRAFTRLLDKYNLQRSAFLA